MPRFDDLRELVHHPLKAARSRRWFALAAIVGCCWATLQPRHALAWTELPAIPKETEDEVIRDVSFISDQQGWALTAGVFFDHYFYKTENGGAEWTRLWSDTQDLRSVEPVPRLKMFAANSGLLMPNGRNGSQTAFFRLTDGGMTRAPITVPYTTEVTTFFFSDDQIGWISGNSFPAPAGRIAFTNNGGGDWTYQPTPVFPSGTQIYDIFFFDSQNGWACGGRGIILRTADGGATWELARVETREALYAIRFADTTHGWCVGGNGAILYSNNGGRNWWPQNSGIEERILDLDVLGPQHVIAVAGSLTLGRVVSTLNRGAVWRIENIPSEDPLSGVEHFGDRLFAFGGTSGSIFDNRILTRTFMAGSDSGIQPFIVARALPGATLGVEFKAPLEAINGAAPYSWSSLTSLPPGIGISGGELTGIPQAAGDFQFALQVTDAADKFSTRSLSLTVVPQSLGLLPPQFPNATHRKKYEEAIPMQGGVPPFAWRVSAGALPPGVIVDEQGVIAGVPFSTGTYNFSVEVTDSNSLPQKRTGAYSITVDPLEESGWEVLHSNNLIHSPRAFTADHAIAGGTAGFLHETHSGGRAWKLRDMGWGEIYTIAWLGDKGWALTDGGLFYTEDRGETFVERVAPFGSINHLYFIDDLHGWAIGQFLSITTDGGLSWDFVLESGLRIGMWDTMNGLLADRGKVLKRTTDGGHTWTNYQIPGFNTPGSPPTNSTDALGGIFLRGRHGWVMSNDVNAAFDNKRSTFYTTDQGETWTRVGLGGNIGNPAFLQYLDDNLTGWAGGFFEPRIHFTPDGGLTWDSADFNTATESMSVFGLHFLNASKGYAAFNTVGRTYTTPPDDIHQVEFEGSIWGSTDGGRTYSQQYGWPAEVEKVDANSGIYTAGMSGPTITDVEFLDPLNGMAIGADPVNPPFPLNRQSRLYHTNSGGARWTLVGIYPHIIREFAFRTPTSGFAVAQNVASLLETRDAGATILDRPEISPEGSNVPPATPLTEWMDVAFADDLYGWAIALPKNEAGDQGGRRSVIRTTDGGRTWTKISEDAALTVGNDWKLCILDRMHLWRYRPTFARIDGSVDGGVTWTPQNPTVVPFSAQIRRLAFSNAQNGYALVDDHSLLTTTNGGTTWEGPVELGMNRITKDILMVNCARGWIGGVVSQNVQDLGNAILWQSDLSGQFTTSTLTLHDYRHEVTRLAAADSNNVWALGSFGLVMKYSGATGDIEIATGHELPDAREGQPFSQALAVINNTGELDWDLCNASLPPGLEIDDQGVIDGTPDAPGTFRFIVAAQDEAGRVGSKQFRLRILPAIGPTIDTAATLPAGAQGVEYATELAASETEEPYTWTLEDGALPPGLEIFPWGTISGIPTTAGEFTFTLRVADGQPSPGSSTREFTISVSGEFAPPGVQDIVNYILGITIDSTQLDVNEDGRIDAGDIIHQVMIENSP